MPIDVAEIVCRNQECRVSETGKCVEGLTVEDCPQIVRDASAKEVSPTEEKSPIEHPPEDIALPKAERLVLEDASAILRAVPTRVVAIIGPTSSGKTSLIASLCDLFQQGPVGRLQYARSRTLIAFEQACHHARASSLRNSPQTEHTGLGSGVGFYHLVVQNGSSPTVHHLLLADRPGEDYRSVADDPAAATDFVEVHRANVITVLVNGELLLDISSRHNVRHEVGMILQGLVNGDATRPSQRVALVLTKIDTIARATNTDKERAERDFEGIDRSIQQTFGQYFAEIRPFKIAASPSHADVPHGYGVAELLDFWAAPEVVRPDPDIVLRRAARAMGRFSDSRAEGRS